MTLRIEEKIHDDLPDAIGICLRKLNNIPTWNRKKVDLFGQFIGLAKNDGYIEFQGDFRDYHLECKGHHCLYQVPLNQRGALKVFGGTKIRLVCGGSSGIRGGRIFYAKKCQ